nr:hypothetical protein [Saprospiraceae bacterium]
MIFGGFEEWWITLSLIQQIFFVTAAVSSFFFVVIFIASLFGFDSDTDFDFDADADSGFSVGEVGDFTLLSVRGIVAFFTFFGWGGFLILNSGGSAILAIGFALFAGFAALFVVGYLLYVFNNLTEVGNFNIQNALYKEAEVYLPISGEENPGRVQVIIGGVLREAPAISIGTDRLNTGELVTVVGVKEDGMLVVEPLQVLETETSE